MGSTRDNFETGANAFDKFVQVLANEPVYQFAGDYQRRSILRSLDAADRLLTSPSAKAFDLSLEDRGKFDAYNSLVSVKYG
jgi:hypothetical protein